MGVLFWVQHLLGSGHLKRAATLARALVDHGLDVTLVSGGPPAPWLLPSGVALTQLPPVHARDLAFSALVDEADRPLDDALRAARRQRLLRAFEEQAPQVVITEMFPFGRRGFLFELLPLLEAAGRARPRPWLIASVRDILVTKSERQRYVWMRDVALAHYDRVLAHTDPALVPFGLTFPYAEALGPRLVSTGYVVEPGPPPCAGDEVVVSAGAGRVGGRLLATALAARPLTRLSRHPWRLIGGGASAPERVAELGAGLPDGVVVEQQRDDFQAVLAKSLLSVSQAGYNTVVEVLRLGKPMVLVPFETATETEQTIRAGRLRDCGLAEVLGESELTPQALARAIDATISRPAAHRLGLDLDGAAASARLVAELAGRAAPVEPGR